MLLVQVFAFCLGSIAMAQEPAKAAAKKKKPTLATIDAAQPQSKADMEARVKAKQAHYEAMKAGAQPAEADAKVAPAASAKGSRAKKAN